MVLNFAIRVFSTPGDVFAWTSNVQLISKVYLKKHTSMGRTYTLNKKDSKMVGDAMKKKL